MFYDTKEDLLDASRWAGVAKFYGSAGWFLGVWSPGSVTNYLVPQVILKEKAIISLTAMGIMPR